MEVELHSDKLVDFPYTSEYQGMYVFDETQIRDFISDLTLGTPTCYLVSGYRGVGKTSLIKKVEAEIRASPAGEELVFVYTSFARYESKTHLVRKLIQELYLNVEKTQRFETLKNSNNPEFATRFDILYQQTFKEVSEVTDRSLSHETTVSSKVSATEAIKSAGNQIAPLLGLIPWYLSTALQKDIGWLIEWILPVVSIGWTIANIVNVQLLHVAKRQSIQRLYTRTLFDDEIAGTLFLDTLKQLKNLKFKVVFVLDELDKVTIGDLDLLVSEMKPYLMCGYSDFIVVGGQNLFYKFNEDDSTDDSILSSLFSKVYHVPISSPAILRDLFYSQLVKKHSLEKLSEEERITLDTLLDYIIFNSRLIPRRFITRLRQTIVWKTSRAFLLETPLLGTPGRYRQIINAIDKLDDLKVEGENQPAIRDYIISKMYLKCASFLVHKSSVNKKLFSDG